MKRKNGLDHLGFDKYGFRPFVPWPPPQGWKQALLKRDESFFKRLLSGFNPTRPVESDRPLEADQSANLKHFRSI